MSCSNGGVISSIDYASYGRRPGGSCGSYTNPTCFSSNTKDIIINNYQCIGKTSCTLHTHQGSAFNSPDPCPGEPKWLVIQFQCSIPVTALATTTQSPTLSMCNINKLKMIIIINKINKIK